MSSRSIDPLGPNRRLEPPPQARGLEALEAIKATLRKAAIRRDHRDRRRAPLLRQRLGPSAGQATRSGTESPDSLLAARRQSRWFPGPRPRDHRYSRSWKPGITALGRAFPIS